MISPHNLLMFTAKVNGNNASTWFVVKKGPQVETDPPSLRVTLRVVRVHLKESRGGQAGCFQPGITR